MTQSARKLDIIGQAFALADAVQAFMAHARRFYYEVMLSGHACPHCGRALVMLAESRCRCRACGKILDPTVAFQRCSVCGGALRLRIRRYQCRLCRCDVPSRFVFDGLVFDPAYFRQHMAESRQRQTRRSEEFRQQILASRSPVLTTPAAELDTVPGLAAALNDLVGGTELAVWLPLIKGFDLKRYQEHLRPQIGRIPVDFEALSALDKNPRLDRIWRFVALIFMAHAGEIEIEQRGSAIRVKKHDETDDQG